MFQTLLLQESPHLVAATGLAAALATAAAAALGSRAGVAAALALYALATALLVWFYRLPDATAFGPTDAQRLYAPCEGVVREVRYDPASGLHCVVVYLNIFNQHQQYYPVSGTVTESAHQRGTFAPAYLLVKSAHNERHRTVVRTDAGAEVTVVQIAGQFARRIVNAARVDAAATQGARLGMIKFSSRVDTYFPGSHYTPTVRVGDRVLAMQTTLARRT